MFKALFDVVTFDFWHFQFGLGAPRVFVWLPAGRNSKNQKARQYPSSPETVERSKRIPQLALPFRDAVCQHHRCVPPVIFLPRVHICIWKLNCAAALHQIGQQTTRLGHEVTELALFSYGSTLQNRHAVRLCNSLLFRTNEPAQGSGEGWGTGRNTCGNETRLRKTHTFTSSLWRTATAAVLLQRTAGVGHA